MNENLTTVSTDTAPQRWSVRLRAALHRGGAYFVQHKRQVLGNILLSFVLGCGRLAFGAYPLGMGFLAAVPISVPSAYLGVLLSAFFTQNLGLATVLSATMVMVVRYVVASFCHKQQDTTFATSPFFRISLAALGGALCGFYRLLAGGFRLYDAKGALVALGAAALIAFGVCCMDGTMRFAHHRVIGQAIVVFCLLLALKEVQFLGISLAAVLACYATLFAAVCHGAATATVAGLLFGGVISLSLAPAYGIAGLLLGALRHLSLPLALAWACMGAGMYLVYTQGLFVLYQMLAAAMLGGGLLLLTFRRLPDTDADRNRCEQLIAPLRHAALEQRYSALSDAFLALSQNFYALSNTLRRPSLYSVRQACESGMRAGCEGCDRRRECALGKPSALPQTVERLAKQMSQAEGLSTAQADAFFADCVRAKQVQESVNLAYGRLLRKSTEDNRTEIFATDYAALSKLLRHAGQSTQESFTPDYEKTRLVCERAQKMGLQAKGLVVCGTRQLQICAKGVDRTQMDTHDVMEQLERAVGTPLQSPTFSTSQEGEVQMHIERKPLLQAEVASACCAKEGEELCGDSFHSFSCPDGMFYTLLSDGMGSGAQAAVSAGICRVFLEQMLTVGNSRTVSMEMLNDLILQKDDQNFATVDLLEIDLLCQSACFWKSGAAPSYVLRGGNLFKIAANTVPVGVTKQLKAEEIRFALQENDVVLMISDGIAESFEDSLWLLGMMSCEWDDCLQTMAQKILERAKQRHGAADDMTVGLVRVTKA